MNERIRELIRESNLDMYGLGKERHRWEYTVEKFAELIVRECAELFVDQKYMILNPHEPFANERVRALKEHDKDTVKKIKKHFGVDSAGKALAQPKQEQKYRRNGDDWVPLYTAPPQRKPLTDEDVERIVREARVGEHGIGYTIARAIEAAHDIKE